MANGVWLREEKAPTGQNGSEHLKYCYVELFPVAYQFFFSCDLNLFLVGSNG